jgi:hypothetical protein
VEGSPGFAAAEGHGWESTKTALLCACGAFVVDDVGAWAVSVGGSERAPT